MYRSLVLCSISSICVAAFQLPQLDYEYSDLAPNISKQIMQLHHSKHHQGYINGLNDTLAQPGYKAYQKWSLNDLLLYLMSHVPAAIQDDVRFYAGGHANHAFFWRILKSPRTKIEPHGKLLAAIKKDFGSFEVFQDTFTRKASNIRGSGWAWLVMTQEGRLAVRATHNQDSPLLQGEIPILGLDVWEHAYYLTYLNDRSAYINNWWDLVNWDFAERLYTAFAVNKTPVSQWFDTVMQMSYLSDAYRPASKEQSRGTKQRTHNGTKARTAA